MVIDLVPPFIGPITMEEEYVLIVLAEQDEPIGY